MANFAIVVGINEYPQRAGQNPLDGAVDDACDFADWVLNPAGGDVPRENLYFWTHPWPADPHPVPPAEWTHPWQQPPSALLRQYLQNPPEWEGDQEKVAPGPARAPNAREIVDTATALGVELMAAAMTGGSGTNRIFVFLAGHGIRTHEYQQLNSQTCFVAGDFKGAGVMARGLVPCESFRKNLLTGGFQEVFMFLDCCRVQDTLLSIPAEVICGGVNEEPTLPWSVGNAAADGARAFEVPGQAPRGAFSVALLEGLRTHREPGSNSLPASTLETFVIERIQTKSRGQVPHFVYNPSGAPGPVIVTGGVAAPAAHPTLVLDLTGVDNGTQLRLLGADLAAVAGVGPIVAGDDPVEISNLAPGLYVLERVGGGARLPPFRHPDPQPICVG